MHDNDDARMPADAPFSLGAASMVPLTGDYRIDALLGPCQWAPGSTITYSFYSDAVFAGSYYGSEPVAEVSAGVKANVRTIMPALGALMNLTFVEVPETSTSIGKIRFMKSSAPAYAYAYYPCSTSMFSTSGDVFLNTAYDRLGDTNGFQNSAGYHGYVSLIHEIGHAIGLKHPHDTGGSGVTLPTAEDTHTQTVMSYNFNGNSPATMMGYDLMALHYIYGARPKNSGATTYLFTRSNVDQFSVGGLLSINPSGPTKQAIWDDSGPNTLDFSGVTPSPSGYRIDTRPLGYISPVTSYVQSPLYLVNGTVVGPNVTINTIVNSRGDDTIYANSAPNTFSGYGPGKTVGHDVIVGAQADDVIDLTGFAPNGVTQTASGNDLLITFNASNNLRIQDYYTAHPIVRYQSVVTTDGATPFSGSGVSQTFTLRYSDSNGASQLQSAWVWFAADQSSSAHSCVVWYDAAAQQVKLLDDAGQTWSSGAPGAAATLQNTQCAVSLAGASTSASGDTLTFVAPVTFTSTYTGTKNIYGFGASRTGVSSGWQDLGDWTVPTSGVVTADTVSPASGSGASQTFVLKYSDSLGGNDLVTTWAWFAPSMASAANSCLLTYTRATNTISLLNDNAATWTSATAGTNSTLQNAQCTVSLAGTSASVNANVLTVTVAMTFKGSFAGAKNTYLYAASAGSNSGWQDRGDWTVPVPPTASVTADSSTPTQGSGTSQTFSLAYSSTTGAGDVSTAWVWFAPSTASAQSSCLVWYDRAAGFVRLIDDAGSVWMSAAIGSASTLRNAQCSVNVAGITAASSGNTLTLSLPVTFSTSFAGTKNIYLYATNAAGQNSGWQDRGDWTVPQGGAITGSSMTPSSGQGTSQAFALRYADSAGAADLRTTWVWFTTSLTAPADHSCLVYYTPQTNTLFLLDDAGTQWLPATLGSQTVLQNGQCGVNAATSTVSAAGNDLTLTLAATFQRSYAGAKNAYLYATGVSGSTPAWTQVGSWTIPAGTITADSVTPNAGSGSSQSFVLTYSDADGFADLATTWLWLTQNVNGSAASSCLVYVDHAARTINLLNDAGSGWLPGALGTSGTVRNGQCTLDLSTSDAVGNGTTLRVTLGMAFSPTFSGQRHLYMYASGGGASSGWQDRGTWTVP